MHSFLILGDTSVHNITGLKSLDAGLKSLDPPKPLIYEGAALAGRAVEQSLEEIDPVHNKRRSRVCRYTTPLDRESDFWFRQHPFGDEGFENFEGLPDPLKSANIEWTVSSKSYTDDSALKRFRLIDEKSLPKQPFGAHSWSQLESIRPGGVFSYGTTYRYRCELLQRLLHDAIRIQIVGSLHSFASDAAKELARKLISDQEQNAITDELTIRKLWPQSNGDTQIEIFYDYLQRASLLQSVTDTTVSTAAFEAACVLITMLSGLPAEHGTSNDSGKHSRKLPDLVVLYDLYQGSKKDAEKPHGEDSTTYRHGLRHVPLLHDQKNKSEIVRGDFVCIVRAWLATTYGHLLKYIKQQLDGTPLDESQKKEITAKLHKPAESLVVKYAAGSLLAGVKDEILLDESAVTDFQIDDQQKSVITTSITEIINDSTKWNKPFEEMSVKAKDGSYPLFQSVVRLTMARLACAENILNSRLDKLPRVKPLTICCLKTLDMPDLLPAKDEVSGTNSGSNYLVELYRNSWLRDRTIVILDADFLRMLKEDPAGISSETSWEEIVQDTIDAFQRQERLNPFLHFGYLVIRYGVSGALLLYRQTGGDLTARLFFDPNKNDRDWSPHESGEILGYTSIFAASIAQAITVRCEQRVSEPVQSDILDALLNGISHALRRCQVSCAYGYPEKLGNNDEEHKFIADQFFRRNGLLPGLFMKTQKDIEQHLSEEFRGISFPSSGVQEFINAFGSQPKWISSSIMPIVGSARWSIVDHSCRANIEKVAFEIVQGGVDHIMNRSTVTEDDLQIEAQKLAKEFESIARVDKAIDNKLMERVKGLWQEILSKYDPLWNDSRRDGEIATVFRSDEVTAAFGHVKSSMTEKPTVSEKFEGLMKSVRGELMKSEAYSKKTIAEVKGHALTDDTMKSTAQEIALDFVSSSERSKDIILESLKERLRAKWQFLLWQFDSSVTRQTRKEEIESSFHLSDVKILLAEVADQLAKRHTLFDQFVKLMKTISWSFSKSRRIAYAMKSAVTLNASPIGRFGKRSEKRDCITAIDRREIEGISAIQRVINQYVQRMGDQRPLSIAAFGPPGSGKSTVVKRLAKALGDQISYNNLEFNLSQYTDVSELKVAFEKIRKCREAKQDPDGKINCIPLAFFDEFDCKFAEADFGWLKYFLAPMEDGSFQNEKIGPAILVFAGGTSQSFHSFAMKGVHPSDERWVDFSRAKGPDFVSRLNEHLNIVGIDPTDPDDEIWLLRRAVLFRDMLEFKKLVDDDGRARIDDPRVLKAILHAPTYRYGGRSLRMLIEACTFDKMIRRSHIPASHELDMMVDSKSFLSVLRSK